jgi:hypothetical protein
MQIEHPPLGFVLEKLQYPADVIVVDVRDVDEVEIAAGIAKRTELRSYVRFDASAHSAVAEHEMS